LEELISSAHLRELESIVGRENVLSTPEDLVCYGYDATHCEGEPSLVVRPGSAGEVAEIVRLANRPERRDYLPLTDNEGTGSII